MTVFNLIRPRGRSHFSKLIGDYRQYLADEALKQYQRRCLRTRIELAADYLRDVTATDGDKRLSGIRYTLNNLGISRSEDQVRFHQAFTHACLQQIYNESWAEHSVRVMEQENIQKLNTEVLIMTPRRWGKTWSVAMYVAALLLNVPGIQIGCFSTGRRASGSLMEIVAKMITLVPGGYRRIIRRTQEHLYVSSVSLGEDQSSNGAAARALCDAPDTARFISLPASVNGKSFLFGGHTHNPKATRSFSRSAPFPGINDKVSSADIFMKKK